MSDPLIRSVEHYVVLEPGKPEKIISKEEVLQWLSAWLSQMDQLPKDLQTKPSLHSAAQHLIDTACELEIEPGINLQWFAVRLDPPET